MATGEEFDFSQKAHMRPNEIPPLPLFLGHEPSQAQIVKDGKTGH